MGNDVTRGPSTSAMTVMAMMMSAGKMGKALERKNKPGGFRRRLRVISHPLMVQKMLRTSHPKALVVRQRTEAVIAQRDEHRFR